MKETPTKVFYKNFKSNFFTGHLWKTAFLYGFDFSRLSADNLPYWITPHAFLFMK